MCDIQKERESEWKQEDKEFYSQNGYESDDSHLTEKEEYNRTRGKL